MDISIVIVNYNVKEYIISCIQSIYKHSKSNFKFEIIVVDNNSKDGSCEEIKKEFAKIILIKNNINLGFSRAVNQGVKKCKGNYLLILNPDTLFVEDSIKKLFNDVKNLDELGVIGPKLISIDNITQQSFWKKPTIINTLLSITYLDFFNFNKNYKSIKFDKILKVDSISGCGFFLKREVFDRLNGFNENLFWMEDIDFCVRLKKIGYNVYYSPFTKIIHYGGKSAKTNYSTAISNQLISKIKYFEFHHSKLGMLTILLSIIFLSIIKSIYFSLLYPVSDVYKKKLAAYLYTLRSIISTNWFNIRK